MSVERTRRFLIRGNQTYQASGDFRLDFNDVPVLALGHTYVRWVELALDINWLNTNAAAQTVPEPIAHNVLKSLQARISGGHVFYDHATQAGQALMTELWQTSGIRPESNGDAVVPGSGTNGGVLTTRMKFCVPIGYLFGAAEGDDYNVTLKELQKGQASLEFVWANGAVGGNFDTATGAPGTVSIQSASIRAATIVMIARPEARVAPLLTRKTQVLSGVEERPLTANHVVHYMGEMPTWDSATAANRRTEVFITTGRTLIQQLDFDGVNVVENVYSQDAITIWNRKASTAVDRIGQLEAGAAEVLPIYSPSVDFGKVTHKPSSREHPVLKLEGTPTTPRLLIVMSRLLTDTNTAESANLMGVAYDDSASVAKTLSKTDLDRKSGNGAFNRLPRKLSAPASA